MKLLTHPRIRVILILLIADSLLFSLTNPDNVPSLMLISGFLLLAATFYYLVLGLMAVAGWYGLSTPKHRRRFARLTTGVVAGVIALQSIGELSARDILVLLPLAILAYLYVSYGQVNRRASQKANA
jgi:uncharacterized membrane protein YfhO